MKQLDIVEHSIVNEEHFIWGSAQLDERIVALVESGKYQLEPVFLRKDGKWELIEISITPIRKAIGG